MSAKKHLLFYAKLSRSSFPKKVDLSCNKCFFTIMCNHNVRPSTTSGENNDMNFQKILGKGRTSPNLSCCCTELIVAHTVVFA